MERKWKRLQQLAAYCFLQNYAAIEKSCTDEGIFVCYGKNVDVTTPVAIYNAQKDQLATAKYVYKIINELPNITIEYLIAADDFSHNDFIYDARLPSIVYDEVVENMKLNELKSKRKVVSQFLLMPNF